MSKIKLNLQEIYLQQMVEVRSRLIATDHYINIYLKTDNPIDFDCAILQFRKALEATAYASISPNKDKYRSFRSKAVQSQDFTKDFNATKIFQYLGQVNKDFYPIPVYPATKQPDDSWHFAGKKETILTKEKFQKLYDRLGKFLHADNPWDSNKHRHNITKDVIVAIKELRNLLQHHATLIKVKDYSEVWIIEVQADPNLNPAIITAIAVNDLSSLDN